MTQVKMREFFHYITLLILTTTNAIATNKDPETTCTAINPAPSNCGVRGSIPYQKTNQFPASSPQIVSSVDECATLCGRRLYNIEYYGYFYYPDANYQPYCKSFQYTPYNRTAGECTLGRLPIETIVVASNKSKTSFYDQECYDCGKVCVGTQPLGSQLLDNGGFEEPLLGPWFSNQGSLTKGYKSSHAFRCAKGYQEYCLLSQEVNMCKGELYALKFDYLTIQTTNSTGIKPPSIRAGYGGPGLHISGTGYYRYSAFSTNTDPNAWKTVRAYFLYRAGEHTGPSFTFRGGGTTSVDNVRLYRVPPNPDLVQPQVNLFQNPGFETGDFGPWNPQTHTKRSIDQVPKHKLVPFKIVSPGINSQYAVSFTSGSGYPRYASRTLSQIIKTKPDTTYLFSFNVEVLTAAYDIYVTYGPEQFQTTVYYSDIAGNYTYSLPIVTQTRYTKVRIQLLARDGNAGEKILLDNFSMLEVAKSRLFP